MKIRWPRLVFPPINLWRAPHLSARENTMAMDQMYTDALKELEAAERERALLGEAIRDAAINAGILRADASVSGPMLLMLCQDLVDSGKQREQALAAHVERLRIAALDAIHFIPGGDTKAALRDAYDETPETSLARQKLQWQAEALESCADALEECGYYAAAAGTRKRAEHYRRQAEKTEHADAN